MGVALPEVSLEAFSVRLNAQGAKAFDRDLVSRLHRHYEELRRWNTGLSLVGPGTRDNAIERHYAESLASLDLLPTQAGTLVDVGSGAGFPGLILAAALPELKVTLVEARAKKCAFLLAAARRMALPVTCLNARVARPLPAGLPASIDIVTMRAVRIEAGLLEPLLPLLTSRSRVLIWCGSDPGDLPAALTVVGERPLTGSTRILALGMRGE